MRLRTRQRFLVDAKSLQQFRQFIGRMRASADQCVEVCRRNAKVVCNACKLAAIEAADFPDRLPVLEPIAKEIDDLGDDWIWCRLGCHCSLRRWLGFIISLAGDSWY